MISRSPATRDRRALRLGGCHSHTPHAQPSRVGYDPAASFLYYIVLADGLVMPPEQSEAGLLCGSKLRDPREIDLRLARRAHRIEALDKVQKRLFRECFDALLRLETKLLTLFRLPKLQRIVETLGTPEDKLPEDGERFTATLTQWDRFGDLFDEFVTALIGEEEARRRAAVLYGFKAHEPRLPPYPLAMQRAYLIGAEHVIEDIRKRYGPMFGEDFEERYTEFFGHPSYQKLLDHGMDRVVDYAVKVHRTEAREILAHGVARGHNPLVIARRLHKELGGQAWKWQRLARSETALAVNDGTTSAATIEGASHLRWSAAAGACERCAPLDGQVWNIRDSYPEPVSSTHPNCLCLLVPEYRLGPTDIVQRPWKFPDPYGGRPPWTEIDPTYIQQSYAGQALAEAAETAREAARLQLEPPETIIPRSGLPPIGDLTPEQSDAVRDIWAWGRANRRERMAAFSADMRKQLVLNGTESQVPTTTEQSNFMRDNEMWSVHFHPRYMTTDFSTPPGLPPGTGSYTSRLVEIKAVPGFSNNDLGFYGTRVGGPRTPQVVIADDGFLWIFEPPPVSRVGVSEGYAKLRNLWPTDLNEYIQRAAGTTWTERFENGVKDLTRDQHRAFEKFKLTPEGQGWRMRVIPISDEEIRNFTPVDLGPDPGKFGMAGDFAERRLDKQARKRRDAGRVEQPYGDVTDDNTLDWGPPIGELPDSVKPDYWPKDAPWPPPIYRYS